VLRTFEAHAEVARTVRLHTPIFDLTIAAFEGDARRIAGFAARA